MKGEFKVPAEELASGPASVEVKLATAATHSASTSSLLVPGATLGEVTSATEANYNAPNSIPGPALVEVAGAAESNHSESVHGMSAEEELEIVRAEARRVQHTSISSAEMSLEEAEKIKTVSLTWTNTTDACRVTTYFRQTIGTAPWCDANYFDCINRGMEFERFCTNNCPDGGSCWKGEKAICRVKTVRMSDECNPECSISFRKMFVGTAPSCGGSDCDCIRQGMVPYGKYDDYQCPCNHKYNCPIFGSKCMRGQKVLCLKPTTWSAEVDNEVKRADCTHRDEISSQERQKMMDTTVELAKVGAEVAAKRR